MWRPIEIDPHFKLGEWERNDCSTLQGKLSTHLVNQQSEKIWVVKASLKFTEWNWVA